MHTYFVSFIFFTFIKYIRFVTHTIKCRAIKGKIVEYLHTKNILRTGRVYL